MTSHDSSLAVILSGPAAFLCNSQLCPFFLVQSQPPSALMYPYRNVPVTIASFGLKEILKIMRRGRKLDTSHFMEEFNQR